MTDSQWRRSIALGVTVIVDGVPYVVDKIDGIWVTLLGVDGSTRRVPLRELALTMMDENTPPPVTQNLDTLEARMSDQALAKLDARRAIVRWYDKGLRPDQPDDGHPDPLHDPALVPRNGRILAMARAIAARDGIKVESAQKQIRRILAKGAAGDPGLVDPRLLKPELARRHLELETAVHQFMNSRDYQTRVTGQSSYTLFCGWMRRERGAESPSKREFERQLTSLYQRYPELRQKAKTLESAIQRPQVATQRRSAARVGEYWLIDTTASNVMLRDPYAPRSKPRDYRLANTTIMDGASRYVVGHAISEDANALSTSLALANAFLGMVDGHDAIVFEGRTYPRPFPGLPRVMSRYPVWPPRRLLADNGTELINRQALWNMHRFGTDCEALRVKDPRGKAPLERHFGTKDKSFDQLQANYLGHAVDQRGRKADKDVFLTWEELAEREQQWIDSYNVTEQEGLKAQLQGRRISPAARWIELVEEHGITEVPTWHNEWILFLPNQVVRLNRYGISRRRLIYNAPVLAALIDIDGAAPSGTVRIFWNPNDLRQMYCFDRDGNAWELPWVYRTDETAPFSDFTLDWALKRLEGITRSKQEHQELLRNLLHTWQSKDIILLAQLNGKLNAQEILVSQIDALQSMDAGSILGAEAFVGQNVIDAIQAADEQIPEDDDVDPFTGDLFGQFD